MSRTIETTDYDVVIVGAGATGGWAAKRFSEAGLSVAVLEAGPLTHLRDLTAVGASRPSAYTEVPADLLKTHPIQSGCYACRRPMSEWFVNDKDNPYEQPTPFSWIRMRALGGRLLAWEGQCYRMSDQDFLAAERDGKGNNWPISYSDLQVNYDRIERYLGVTGDETNVKHLPSGPLLPVSEPNITFAALKEPIAKHFNRPVIQARVARKSATWWTLEELPYANNHESVVATPWTAIKDAAASRRCTVFTNTIAAHVKCIAGSATSVSCVNRITYERLLLHGKLFILCASTLESTRLLMNSGICNSSGLLGSGLMDHIFGAGASGRLRATTLDFNNGGFQRHRVYIPRFRNLGESVRHPFTRGYGVQGKCIRSAQTSMTKFVEDATGICDTRVHLTAFGECLSSDRNRVSLGSTRDKWGIPSLRIDMNWSHNEYLMMEDARRECARMLMAAELSDVRISEGVSTPGLSIHEVGTARMGTDPYTSVVNEFCRTHDINNIYVTDGACWVSSGCQNPTLTMLAITDRACSNALSTLKHHV